MNKTKEIFGLNISYRSFLESILWIEKRTRGNKGWVVYCCTLNEIVMNWDDKKIKKIFKKADLLTADGMPLVWVLRHKTKRKVERVYGPDLMERMLDRVKDSHIFVGDKKNEKYFHEYGKYIVMPIKEKFNKNDYQKLFDRINKEKGKIVWLGLGSRKQIETAYELKKMGMSKVIITVGAAFDFLSGNKKQSPIWLRNIGGEWLFRLINEPSRLFKRYLKIGIFLLRQRIN